MRAQRLQSREQEVMAQIDPIAWAKLPKQICGWFYRRRNRGKIRAYGAAWRAANKVYRQEYDAAYRAEHRDELLTAKRRYAAEHRSERNAASLRWGKHNPEKRARYRNTWKIRNPERLRDYARMRAALLRGADPAKTISLADIASRDRDHCGICGRFVSRLQRSLDHRVPISLGGQHIEENVQLAHKRCNFRKGNRFSQPTLELAR